VRARLSCLAPIGTAGAQRRELAQAAREAIAGALNARPAPLVAGDTAPARA
jgi:hypothetical protein